MKKIFCILSVSAAMLFFAERVQAQNSNPGATPTPTAQPSQPQTEIQFETEVHDFGDVKQGAPTAFKFKFKNVGKEPLILSRVQASCGCTVPTWPKEPIMPGKSAEIEVTYNSNNPGVFSKGITVESNAKNTPKTLMIKGNVIAEPKSPVVVDPNK